MTHIQINGRDAHNDVALGRQDGTVLVLIHGPNPRIGFYCC